MNEREMTREELVEAVAEKMTKEQDDFENVIKAKGVGYALFMAYEYSLREDILYYFTGPCTEVYDEEYCGLTDDDLRALLASDEPLYEIEEKFEQLETDHMQAIGIAVEETAHDLAGRSRGAGDAER